MVKTMMMMIMMKFVDENQNIEGVTTFLGIWWAGNRTVENIFKQINQPDASVSQL
jgi:hypothetical protein